MKCAAESLLFPAWVLIVDNEAMLADAYETIIERAGGRPISVGKATDAKLVLRNKRIDVVLLDFRMPIREGMHLLQWLNARTDIAPVVVVLSNHDSPDDVTRAYELGADSYVLKAWASPNDLINVLNETFKHSLQKPRRMQLQR